jgi:hypothetical protein
MAHWTLIGQSVAPERATDGDRKFRLTIRSQELLRAERALRFTQELYDAEIAAARKQGQDELVAATLSYVDDQRKSRP